MRHTGRVEPVGRLLFCLFFIIGVFFVGLSSNFEVVDVTISDMFLLADEEGHLLRVGRGYFFADEDVGERLVVVQETAVGIGQEKVVVEFPRHEGGVFYLGEDVFEQWTFFIVGENPPILKEVYHLRY